MIKLKAIKDCQKALDDHKKAKAERKAMLEKQLESDEWFSFQSSSESASSSSDQDHKSGKKGLKSNSSLSLS